MENGVRLVKVIISVAVMLTMLFCLGIAAAVPAAAADNEIAATDSNVRYSGHWAKSGNNMKGYFQSTMEVRFTGTSLKVKSNKTLAVKIDGGEYKEITSSAGIVNAASGLAAGNHKAIIIMPLPNNTTTISGFVIDSGATLLAPDDAKHIAFIGDSITMGHYGDPGNFPSGAGYKDSIVKNYVIKTALALDMVPNATAIGGIGIEKANNPAIDELGMAERYFRLGEYSSDAKNKAYDTSIYTPDYIVIALGTNGEYTESTATSTQAVYENMLIKLRTAYPKAKIFCVTPFQSNVQSLELKKTIIIQQSVTNRKKDGDKNVYDIDASQYITNTAKVKENPAGETLDGVHPTYEGHTKIANNLVSSINSKLLKENYQSTSSKKTYSGYYGRSSNVSGTSSVKAQTTSNKADDTSSKNNTTSKKKGTSSKNNDVGETVIDNSNTVETYDQQTAKENLAEEKGKSIMDYMWILIVVAAVAIAALIVVIFLPQIKALFKK